MPTKKKPPRGKRAAPTKAKAPSKAPARASAAPAARGLAPKTIAARVSNGTTADVKMTELYLFPSVMWHADMPGADKLKTELLAAIARLRTQMPSSGKSNRLGWHSPPNMHRRAEFKALCTKIEQMAVSACRSMSTLPGLRPVIEAMWININPKHAHNGLHDHPRSALSGIFYLQTDEKSGRLRFRDPRAAKRMNPWPVESDAKSDARHWDRVSLTPTAGRLVMFPSWLEHEVEANQSDREQISVSFNMGLRRTG